MTVTIVYHCAMMEVARRFFRQLAASGVDVHVIVPARAVIPEGYARSNDLRYDPGRREPGVTFHPVALLHPRQPNLGFRPLALRRALARSRPDLIQVFNEYHGWPLTQVLLTAAFLPGPRVPVTIYGFQNIDPLTAKDLPWRERGKNILRRPLIAFNIRRLAGALISTDEGCRILRRHRPDVNVRRLFWGIDRQLFQRLDRAACRREFGLPEDARLAGYIGRLEPEKGVFDLLEAVAAEPGLGLFIVGQGSASDALRRQVNEQGMSDRVWWAGSLPPERLGPAYNALDCLVLASRSRPFWKEQYGRVLVEAMFCGIPVAASDSGAIPEVLEGYPLARTFPEGDIAGLRAALRELTTARANQTPEFDLRPFTLEHFVQAHKDFYRNVLRF